MQLRRGPPGLPLPASRVRALRVITAPPGPIDTRRGGRTWKPLESYTLRVVAGILLVSIPLSVTLGFVIATWSPQTSIEQTNARAGAPPEGGAVRITDSVGERQRG